MRFLHQTYIRHAITNLQMPAMSPTMTEGGITAWKKREGEVFSAGDVLLEIETDKATIDVEAQDNGVLGKILLQDGTKNVHVGKVIALLAEEGDDISSLKAPEEESPVKSSYQPPPPRPSPSVTSQLTSALTVPAKHLSHSRPLFPSVHRLLFAHNIAEPENIKGTGVRGMLTKGDILTYLGKASGPSGTYREPVTPAKPVKAEAEPEALDGLAIRRLIASAMLQSSLAIKAAQAPARVSDFDSVVADYFSNVKAFAKAPPPPTKSGSNYLDGLY